MAKKASERMAKVEKQTPAAAKAYLLTAVAGIFPIVWYPSLGSANLETREMIEDSTPPAKDPITTRDPA